MLAISLVSLAALSLLSGPLKASLTDRLVSALEHRIPPGLLPTDQSLAGIIVLGGSPARVVAALELAELFPDVPIILSGPGKREIALAEAAVVRGSGLIIDHRPKNTYENALYSHQLRRGRLGPWAVVTSALHMPRAIASFSAVDFPVVPWPVKDTPTSPRAKRSAVWHEVLGLAGYWAMGRTRTLYPDPPVQHVTPPPRTASDSMVSVPSS